MAAGAKGLCPHEGRVRRGGAVFTPTCFPRCSEQTTTANADKRVTAQRHLARAQKT
jgi:hypothetical protein